MTDRGRRIAQKTLTVDIDTWWLIRQHAHHEGVPMRDIVRALILARPEPPNCGVTLLPSILDRVWLMQAEQVRLARTLDTKP